jgi:Zn-dependent protease/CBS domain-containing protein
MKWSLFIGRYAGIRVQIHLTFVVLLLWIGLSLYATEQSASTALRGVGFVLALFLCVLLHEFGHALTARRFGVRTRDITLLPIGGVARLERMPDKPVQELLVAIAGPAVNIVIAILLVVVLGALGRPVSAESLSNADMGLAGPGLLERLLVVNVMLVAFNMIPAFPMDGGRVLRALLAMRWPYAVATARAASVGKLFAALFAVLGFYTNPFLILIAVFVWVGASQESAAAQTKGALDGVTVVQAMITDYKTLSPVDSLSHAVDLLLAGSQQDFPVEDEGRVLGILTRQALLTALARKTEHLRVIDAMQRDVPHAEVGEMLDVALQRMQSSPIRTMPVLQRGALVGLLTMENVGEYVSVQAALARVR